MSTQTPKRKANFLSPLRAFRFPITQPMAETAGPHSHIDGCSVAVGDFNGDGKPDLAVTVRSDFSVLLTLLETDSRSPKARIVLLVVGRSIGLGPDGSEICLQSELR